jgi:hypothetical protein
MPRGLENNWSFQEFCSNLTCRQEFTWSLPPLRILTDGFAGSSERIIVFSYQFSVFSSSPLYTTCNMLPWRSSGNYFDKTGVANRLIKNIFGVAFLLFAILENVCQQASAYWVLFFVCIFKSLYMYVACSYCIASCKFFSIISFLLFTMLVYIISADRIYWMAKWIKATFCNNGIGSCHEYACTGRLMFSLATL